MSRKNERILVILNPSSGVVSKDEATSYLFRKLREHFRTVSIINSNSPEEGENITREAINHFDIITAFGGDGTINSIAKSLVGTNSPLGILPGGSGNGLVRNLNIPLSWKKAIDVLIHGEDKYIDIGTIDGQYFFNIAGIGLDGLISKKFELESKSRGITPYIYHAFKGYFEMSSFKVNITLGDTEFQDQIMIAAFANFRQYGGKAVIAPFADPYDGKLDLCLINKFKFLEGTAKIQRLFTGNIHKFPFYKSYQFDKVKIKSLDGPIPCTIDGEYANDLTEFEVAVVPGKLKVRIPSTGL